MEEVKLLRKYFFYWRNLVKVKKENSERREKLENLVKRIKKSKRNKQNEAKIENVPTQRLHLYKNRFDAQKTTIERLSIKLEEKDRLIEELKLGIFDKEALNSLNESRIEIREIFANCSKKIRCTIAPPTDYSEKFMVSTQKAPKIIQEMEERAMERAKRRELILERKRQIQESRQRIITEALERKRVQDEEEKKRNLEVIKEKRMRDLEKERKRQINKTIFYAKFNRAVEFHKRILLKRGYSAILRNYTESKRKWSESLEHHKRKILQNAFTKWSKFIEDKYRDKNALADAFFAKNILVRVLRTWQQLRVDSIRSMQVAEDYYDFILLKNSFIHWHRYVCIQIMARERKKKLAEMHYNRRIVFHYFYQWRSLPAVIQLERSKEIKLKKWREKVWTILPDYKPPED